MNEHATTGDMEYHLPCAEALLAGTLALMTGHAQARCVNGRRLMEAKIVANLSQLMQMAVLTPQFRAAVCNVRGHWQLMHDASVSVGTSEDPRLWHASPSSFQ